MDAGVDNKRGTNSDSPLVIARYPWVYFASAAGMKGATWRQNSPGRFHLGLCILGTLAGLACAPARAQQSVELISFTGTTWRYATNNANQGTAWRAVSFDDSVPPWQSGRGILGWEPDPPAGNPQSYFPGFNTVFSAYTPAVITYYFRARYTNTMAPPISLIATNLVDDGLVVYINDVEGGRIRVQNGQTWQTQANPAQPNEGQEEFFSIDPTLLRYGTNVIAVEVHQNGAASTDVAFGMSLVAVFPAVTLMTITSQPQDQTVVFGSFHTLSVGVSGGPGYYQWQANNGAGAYTNVPGATFATFTSVANALGTNAYRVQIFNGSQALTSSAAVVTVVADTFGPLLLTAKVLEEPPLRTNRIEIAWNEPLLPSTVCPGCGSNFTVVLAGSILAGSSLTAAVSNVQYNPGALPAILPFVRLTMHPTNWFIGSNYYVIVNNVRDTNRNVIAPNSIIGVSYPITTNLFTPDTQAWYYHDSYFIDLLGLRIDIYTHDWTATNYDVTTASWGGPAFGLQLFDVLQTNASCFSVLETNHISYQEQPSLFRTTFFWPPSLDTNVDLRFTYGADDGAAFFLNGAQLFRDTNVPAGPINAATRTTGETEGNCKTITIRNVALLPGTNYLAVAVAQRDSDPADTVFGLTLDAIRYPITPVPFNPSPTQTVVRVGTSGMRISWESTNYSYALEYATTTNVISQGGTNVVAGPWLEVQPLMANPYVTNPVSGAHLIYRLRRTY